MVIYACHKMVMPRRVVLQGLKSLTVATRCHSTLVVNSRPSSVAIEPRLFNPPTVSLINLPIRNIQMSSTRNEIVQFHLSDIGEGIKEVTIKEWFVKPGDSIQQFDQICEVQSDKASVTITSRYDGIVKKLHFDIEQVAQTGDALVDIETSGSGSDGGSTSGSTEVEVQDAEAIIVGGEAESSAAAEAAARCAKVLATPAVRRMAAEYNLDLNKILGTGRDGRVLKEDVIAYMESQSSPKRSAPTPAPTAYRAPLSSQPATPPAQKAPQPPPKPVPVVPARPIVIGEDRTEPIKGIMKAMTKTMTEALTIPHFGYCDEFDISKLVELRNELKKSVEVRSGGAVKLSYMPFIIKACSLALHQYPVLNSHFDAKKETITYKASHNIGVAMDTSQGLLVPTIKNAQALSVYEIALELNRLHDLGLRGKLGEADLTGGTMALSNIGSIGGTYAKPVILPPQVFIGAIGRVQTVPRFAKDGSLIKAHIFNISWSADHRVLDGATVARFSNLMKSYLETPASMTLDLH